MAPTKPDCTAPRTPAKRNRAMKPSPIKLSPHKIKKSGKTVPAIDRDKIKTAPPVRLFADQGYQKIMDEDEDEDPDSRVPDADVDDGYEYDDTGFEDGDEEYDEEEVAKAGLASTKNATARGSRAKEKGWMDENGQIQWGINRRRFVDPSNPEEPTAWNNMEKARKKTKGPIDPNGRFVGRHLVNWHRDRMMEKLLLNVQYECHKAGMLIPWDRVVHRLNPGSSGPSATQMLNKLRDVLIMEGHMIPPPLGKRTIKNDPKVRGLVRDMAEDEPIKTRKLLWTEPFENRKKSLETPGIVRGSGNYRKFETKAGAFNDSGQAAPAANANSTPAKSAQRVRMSIEDSEAPIPRRARTTTRKPRPSRKAMEEDEEEGEVEPESLDPDDDYNPPASAGRKRNVRRPVRLSSRAMSVSSPEPESDAPTTPSLVVKLPVKAREQSQSMSVDDEVMFQDESYAGPEEHGSIEEFSDAVKRGQDPRSNGVRYRGTAAAKGVKGEGIDIDTGSESESESKDGEAERRAKPPLTPGNNDTGFMADIDTSSAASLGNGLSQLGFNNNVNHNGQACANTAAAVANQSPWGSGGFSFNPAYDQNAILAQIMIHDQIYGNGALVLAHAQGLVHGMNFNPNATNQGHDGLPSSSNFPQGNGTNHEDPRAASAVAGADPNQVPVDFDIQPYINQPEDDVFGDDNNEPSGLGTPRHGSPYECM